MLDEREPLLWNPDVQLFLFTLTLQITDWFVLIVCLWVKQNVYILLNRFLFMDSKLCNDASSKPGK